MPNNQAWIESKNADYIFETPDVRIDYFRDDGTKVSLNAYKTKKKTNSITFNEFKWVSFGRPEIVNLNNNHNLFQLQSKLSFSLHFETLTKRDKEELANEVKWAKGFTVDPSQFSDMKANET